MSKLGILGLILSFGLVACNESPVPDFDPNDLRYKDSGVNGRGAGLPDDTYYPPPPDDPELPPPPPPVTVTHFEVPVKAYCGRNVYNGSSNNVRTTESVRLVFMRADGSVPCEYSTPDLKINILAQKKLVVDNLKNVCPNLTPGDYALFLMPKEVRSGDFRVNSLAGESLFFYRVTSKVSSTLPNGLSMNISVTGAPDSAGIDWSTRFGGNSYSNELWVLFDRAQAPLEPGKCDQYRY